MVACDLPGLSAATVKSLLDALGDHDAAIAFSDRAEPLCAVWSDRAVPVLRARFQAGERAMHRAIDGLDIAWVTGRSRQTFTTSTRRETWETSNLDNHECL